MHDTTPNRESHERAVSPVIGVILMVAITVILASVIGTFVLDLGQNAGEKAPDISASAADHDDPYSDTEGDTMVTMDIQGVSQTVEVQDIEIRILESDGTTHTFLGPNVVNASGIDIAKNGSSVADGAIGAGDRVSAGDRFTIVDGITGDAVLADDTDYDIQIVYVGSEDPTVVTQATVRLQ